MLILQMKCSNAKINCAIDHFFLFFFSFVWNLNRFRMVFFWIPMNCINFYWIRNGCFFAQQIRTLKSITITTNKTTITMKWKRATIKSIVRFSICILLAYVGLVVWCEYLYVMCMRESMWLCTCMSESDSLDNGNNEKTKHVDYLWKL